MAQRTVRAALAVPGYAQRLNDMYGLLCGTPTEQGVIHAVRDLVAANKQASDSIQKLTESQMRTEQMMRDLTTQVQAIAATGALNTDAIKALKDEREVAKNKVIEIFLRGAGAIFIRLFVVLIGAGTLVWGYLQTGFAKSSH